MIVNGVTLDSRTQAYLDTVLFAETVLLPVAESDLVDGYADVDALHGIRDGDPLDEYFGYEHFEARSLELACEDVSAFFQWLEDAGLYDRVAEFADDDKIAYDFWLTRQGHGDGFWAGDYDDDDDQLGEVLSAKCKEFGEQTVIVTNRGELDLF